MTKIDQKIPEGWSVKKGKDISTLITKGASPKWQGFEYCDSGILFVTSENIREGFLDVSNPKFLPYSFSEKQKKSVLKKGDVLINIVGASIGRSCLYNKETPANINQAVCLFRCSSAVYNVYILMFLSLSKTIRTLLETQTESARPNLSLTDISLLKFLLPPLSEQEKIAEILGCWDDGIEKLSRLIEQKKLLKKGLMQRLLSGKQRSPASQPWKIISIRSFCNIKRGGSPRPIENYLTTSDDGLNWLKIGDISPDAKYIYKTENKIKTEGLSKTTLIHSDDFILSNSMSFGRPYIMKVEACIHDGWLALTDIKKDVSKEYLFYSLISSETQKKFETCAAGSGVRNLNKDIVGNIKIRLPSLPEQKAIADILSKADEEIDLLTSKLSFLKSQKKGLMQKLLTGQIRVKVA